MCSVSSTVQTARWGVPPPATASTRAKFAFGSRLPDTGTSVLKSNGKAKLHTSIRTRHEHDVRSTVNPRKRRRPISQDEDEMTSDAKTSHRPVTVKTALPRQGSRLPAPTKSTRSGERFSFAHEIAVEPSNQTQEAGIDRTARVGCRHGCDGTRILDHASKNGGGGAGRAGRDRVRLEITYQHTAIVEAQLLTQIVDADVVHVQAPGQGDHLAAHIPHCF
ncbi:hypothetical protein GQ600_2789 [Phytophthora cactorum]|nr:hypothetical protein GQ600_2789 [Phytophthora cactorum]